MTRGGEPADERAGRRGRMAGCAPPVAGRGAGGLVARCVRLVEHVTRGWIAVVLSVVFFSAASGVSQGVSGRGGVALAGVWVLFLGSYCALNFWHCRETHCVITGSGWVPLGLLGIAAALMPGAGLSWFGVNAEVAAFVAVLGLGYAVEWVVAARTGRRTVG